jgi:fructose-bisphosphate aldolase class II
VRLAGLSVEGELGKIGGTEDDITVEDRDAMFTEPDEAERFWRETGVDALAVAIGTAHGRYKGIPKLDFDRLKEIKKRVDAPIVLHGSSGVPDEAIREAIALGVAKINIDTNIREAFTQIMREKLMENPEDVDVRKVLGPAREGMIEVVREKIRLFGSSGKA